MNRRDPRPRSGGSQPRVHDRQTSARRPSISLRYPLTLLTVPIALEARRAKAEYRAFGYSYAQVGAGLARKWLFPLPIVEALLHQDTPFDHDAYEPLAGVLHLAAWRARAKDSGMNQREMAVSFPGAVGEVLALDIDMVLQQDPIDWTVQNRV